MALALKFTQVLLRAVDVALTRFFTQTLQRLQLIKCEEETYVLINVILRRLQITMFKSFNLDKIFQDFSKKN
jgi:hypothetical protein